MKLSKSRSQHHKDGVRISKALYEEIVTHATARGELGAPYNVTGSASRAYWVSGTTANVYRYERRAGAVDWNEVRSRNGE